MTPRGAEFVTVNPATGGRATLFDNARLAAALSRAADSAVAAGTLPQRFTFADDGRDEQRLHLRLGKARLCLRARDLQLREDRYPFPTAVATCAPR
ncbi:MAG: hypothetical protein IPJ56_05370 [Gemmatimonadetes bacterium]|nr:hypothetical protein [Gemmatimonadota bacterium]